MSILASVLVTALVALVGPLQVLFGLSPVSGLHWLFAIGLALLQLVFGEVLKLAGK